MPHYQVEECKISGLEIDRVSGLPNFDRLIFRLNEHPPLKLNLNVFAADITNNQLPGSSVAITRLPFKQPKKLRNLFDPAFGKDFVITKDMIDDLKDDFAGDVPVALIVDSIQLEVRRHIYLGADFPTHRRQHFIGYKAIIKRHQ